MDSVHRLLLSLGAVTLCSCGGAAQRIVLGGTASVSAGVYTQVNGGDRWGGADRYAVATGVATRSAAAGWADPSHFAVAVAMPDALTGSGLVGRSGGVLLLSGGTRVSKPTWSMMSNPASLPVSGYLLGGTRSASPALLAELNGAPAMPAMGSGTPAALSGSTALVAGSVGGNTTSVKLVLNGLTKQQTSVVPWGTFIATWKILAKYKTDPSSVYGPRKMRMFKKVGSSYVFTAYAIHGTNEDWVIGT